VIFDWEIRWRLLTIDWWAIGPAIDNQQSEINDESPINNHQSLMF
jgi:hypothetical protein